MSSPEDKGVGANSGQYPAQGLSTYHFTMDNLDPEIPRSSWSFDSRAGGINEFHAQFHGDTAQHHVGGYASNANSAHVNDHQARFVSRTSTPMSMHQQAGKDDVFSTPRSSLTYEPSVSPSYHNSSFSAGSGSQRLPRGSPSSGPDGFRPQQPSFCSPGPAQNNYTPLMGYGHPPFGMNSSYAVSRTPNLRSYTSPETHMSYGMSANMNMTPIPRSNAGRKPIDGKTPNHGPSQTGYGNLPSPYDNRSHRWNGPGNPNQGFGQDNVVPKQDLGFDFNDHRKSFSMAAPSSRQNEAVRRSDLHEMHPDYVAQIQESHYEESGSKDERGYESNEEAAPGRNNAPHPVTSNSVPVKYEAIIKGEKEFNALVTQRAKDLQKVADGIENTCPTTDDDKRAYIEKLFDAIMHTNQIVDKEACDGRKAQAARRLEDGYYMPKVVEFACWQIFAKCKAAANGNTLVAPHHKCKSEGHQHHISFKDRWDSIVLACQHSKAVCKQVLDPSYLDRLVDAPDAQFKMKLNNKKINGERDKQNKLGRAAMNAGVKVDDLPYADEHMVITPSRKSDVQLGRSSGKRRKTNLFKQEFSDEEEIYEQLNFETPVKASHRVLSSRPLLTAHKRTPGKTTTGSSTKAVRPSPFPEPTTELRKEYELRICHLLGLGPENADEFTLPLLRTFARAYHGERTNDNWYHQTFTKGQFCRGHMYNSKYGRSHFCHSPAFSELSTLAIQRGELNYDNSVKPHHHVELYTVKNDLGLKQVLGIAPNAFGMIECTMPPPQEDN
ncbi:uncharacterized protein RSE6_05665 [Rhynchosporium secalis]|uniref:Uncharacterized protein n=1 Tax=Rhynchosporium secalis TaxID=38038 RepID=A0A1E1M8F0_RHYSE|nr:uncharacterized protein RSE6_05665 [Rhynchosporium secalis]